MKRAIKNVTPPFDSLEVLTSVFNGKVDTKIFTYIIKKKDNYIYELKDKIGILYHQIELLITLNNTNLPKPYSSEVEKERVSEIIQKENPHKIETQQ